MPDNPEDSAPNPPLSPIPPFKPPTPTTQQPERPSSIYIASPDHENDEYFTLTCTEKALGVNISGIEITGITPNSWGDRAGLQLDDEIRYVNDVEIGSISKDKKLEVFKQSRPLTLKIKRPFIKDQYFDLVLNEQGLGLGFKGSVITKVKEGLWAERNGIVNGDVIVEVGGVEFMGLNESSKINLFKKTRPINIKIKRPAQYKIDAQKVRRESRKNANSNAVNKSEADKNEPSTQGTNALNVVQSGTVAVKESDSSAIPKKGFLECCCMVSNITTDEIRGVRAEPIGFR